MSNAKHGQTNTRGVFNRLTVLREGSIAPCNMLPAMVMSNIGKQQLQDTWLSNRKVNILRKRYGKPINTIPGGEDCRFAGICTGGCPTIILTRYGTLHVMDRQYCHKKYIEEKNVPV